MPWATTITGVITALGTLLVAVALVINAWTARRRDNRIEKKVDESQKTNNENHKMLNQDRTDRLNYQRALIRALEAKGIEVPIDQSIHGEEGD